MPFGTGSAPRRQLISHPGPDPSWYGVGWTPAAIRSLEPSFITDAMPSLPPPGRDFVVNGTTEDGSEAFSFTFDMPETWDVDDERSGFVFAIPVTWPGALERVSLTGGNESAILDGSTDSPMTILRDPVTGEVRAILRRPAAQAIEIVGEPGLEVLFSPGIPDEVLQGR